MNIPRPARGRKRVRNTVDERRSWGYPQGVSAPLSPLLALLLALPSGAVEAPPAAAADPSQDIALHCRPEALAAFLELHKDTEGYAEEALTIERDGASLRFVRAAERRGQLCQSVETGAQTAAIAHTHPDKADAVQVPVGADCDTTLPNYVVTRDHVYLTVSRAPGARLYRASGDSDDLGSYRIVLDSGWRRRENWTDPAWQKRCAERALEARGRSRRCSRDFDRESEYRRSRGAAAPAVRCDPR
jgi:hypothetical protein